MHAPADEEAHLELAGAHSERGDRRAALRQLERLDQALRRQARHCTQRCRRDTARQLETTPQAVPTRTPSRRGRLLGGVSWVTRYGAGSTRWPPAEVAPWLS